MMIAIPLCCPFCGSTDVGKNGHSANGKQRYLCHNSECSHKTFYDAYTYNAYKPEVKTGIVQWSVDGAGIRAIARRLKVSTDTVIAELKKKEHSLSHINKEYFAGHSSIKIRIEMDEMWSFYGDKEHQIWLWWAVDHDTGEVVAYWFGTREHKNLDQLMALLAPLNIGTVYTDGNYAYFDRYSAEVLVVSKKNTQKIERKHLSLRTWCSRLVRKGIRFSKTQQMHKIVIGLAINVWYFGYHWLIGQVSPLAGQLRRDFLTGHVDSFSCL